MNKLALYSVRLLVAYAFLFAAQSAAQSVGVGTNNPNSFAILDITAPSNDQGMLMPRLTTTERNALAVKINASATPASSNSLLIYDTNVQQYFYWATNAWSALTGGTNAYVYVGYAQDNIGTGYSTIPSATLDYVSFLTTTAPLVPTAANFTTAFQNVPALQIDGNT